MSVVATLIAVASACPTGWSGNSKCMQFVGASTHEGCASVCSAVGGALACIQTAEDDATLMSLLVGAAGTDLAFSAWVGEYQYPFEPTIVLGALNCPAGSCLANMFAGVAYNAQTGWGSCSNGQVTNYTPGALALMQPNNFNAGEDCMTRDLSGFQDQACSLVYPCVCEHGGQTSPDYTATHGPALTQRSSDSLGLLWSNWLTTMLLAVLLGSLPAIVLVLYIELFLVRWKQRVAPTTATEVALQTKIRLGHRRRMRQAGISLWLGGVLFGLSLPANPMFANGSWPVFGWVFFGGTGAAPGAPILWSMLQFPGILFIMLTICPSDTLAIRACALFWAIFVAVRWYLWNQAAPSWSFGPRPEAAVVVCVVLRAIGFAFSLVAAIFWKRHALPGRMALRLLWYCVRLEVLVGGVEYLLDSLPYLQTPLASVAGTPMVAAGCIPIVFSVVMGAPIRRFIQSTLGGIGGKVRDASAAAVIQTMVHGDAIEAIRDAHSRLYTIKISSLEEKDLANNQDSGLFQKTAKADAGECDAFLSHSWRDDAALKWKRFLEYRADFEGKNGGREPRCWLDKACIDQSSDIDASLKALPIFLLASDNFVVFVGDSCAPAPPTSSRACLLIACCCSPRVRADCASRLRRHAAYVVHSRVLHIHAQRWRLG